jgi:uncharacterized protein (TIGR00661 family)
VGKNVLVCPLDWGLGHATRCIPVIQSLQSSGHTVMIAGCGPSLDLLKIEFPSLRFFQIASYDISYSRNIPLLFYLLSKTPALLYSIRKEHEQIEQLVEKENIDVIISDNRYGCYHKKIPSAIIIHQLSLQLPMVLKGIADGFNTRLIHRFDQCWVPDTPSRDLSGKLSLSNAIVPKFIGPLSRMRSTERKKDIDILALISGPEPQRSLFEKLLMDQLKQVQSSYTVVRGLPSSKQQTSTTIDHLRASDLNDLIQSAGIIICRPGYSSIMDLAALKKKAIFVPTPGQTEQLYLAKELERKNIAPYVLQSELCLPRVLTRMKNYRGFTEDYFKEDHLQTTLSEFLD